jgi:colanic acid biosynthesis protein WcaH
MSAFIDQELYDQMLRHMPIACVDVAIVYNGCVLLVRRDDAPALGQWWVPGGRVVKGETMRDTARRKAREEVGLECHVGPIIHTAETIFPDGPRGIPVHSINACFLLYPTHDSNGLSVKLDTHHAEWRWEEKVTAGLHPYVANCLRGAGLEG